MECQECRSDNPDDSRYCRSCGAVLRPSLSSQTKTISSSSELIHPGTLFANRYKIITELGKGGMGIVFKVQDTRLKRTVALKTVLPHILEKPQERERFFREAQAAAALNHPNICTIYEVDEKEGFPYIAMEYVEGENLSRRIESKPLDLKEALDITIQVADGLRNAHEKNIIHRDIKSSNIIITAKGQVKIMDFGLAKLADSTLITKEGMTLGTVACMSPEQARGQKLDPCSDLWSLGVVLYEMLAGQLPFQGETDQVVIYAILHRQPAPLTSLRSGIPLELERIVNKCLEKDKSFRYNSASDLLVDLKRLKRDLDAGKISFRPSTLARQDKPQLIKRFFIPVLASAALLTVLLLAYYLFLHRPAAQEILSRLQLSPLTSGDRLALYPSWSPDGAWIVYSSDLAGSMDIWKIPAEGGEAARLTTSPHNESHPDWSPDGRTIAFSSDSDGCGIFLIPAGGGTALRITDIGSHPRWAPDSERLAFDWMGDIYIAAYTGAEEPRVVVSGTSGTPHTVWTPDGRRLVYWDRTHGDIHVFSLSDGRSKALKLVPSGQEISGLALSSKGRELIFSLGPFGGHKNLWRARFDPEAARVIGRPSPLLITTTDDIHCAFSPDGTRIAFAASQLDRHLWTHPLDPATGMINALPEQVTHGCSNNYYPELSPDGRTLVWTSHLTTQGVLCLKDLNDTVERKVTGEWGRTVREVGASFAPDGTQICYSSTLNGTYEIWRLPALGSMALPLTRTKYPTRDTLTAWSPTGGMIAFYSNRSGNWDIWAVHARGTGQPNQLTQWESNENYVCWSPDGKKLAFRTDKEGNGDIWAMDPDGSNLHPYITHPAEEGWSSWSPNGRFYFTSNRSGVFNVWMRDIDGTIRQITDYKGLSAGLPEEVLFTKFAVSDTRLILPLETRSGNIFILEYLK